MGFDAANVVEPLDWDFTHFDAGKGTIPEPTDKAIDTLFKDLAKASRSILSKAGIDKEGATPEELLTAMAALPEDTDLGIVDMMTDMNRIFAKLCKDSPSAAQLAKLPLRIRMRFFVWLSKELRPEDFGAASTTPSNGQILSIARGA